jgi:hypothetical protein
MVPPRYIVPINTTMEALYANVTQTLSDIDWSSYFRDLGGVSQSLASMPCNYLDTVYGLLNIASSESIPDSYWVASGKNITVVDILTIMSNDTIDLYLSPSATSGEIITKVTVSVMLCNYSGSNCTNITIGANSSYQFNMGNATPGVACTSNPSSRPSLVIPYGSRVPISGILQLSGGLVVDGELTVVSAALSINGNFSVSGTLIVNGDSKITISGCINLTGKLSLIDIPTSGVIINHTGCVMGSFSSYELLSNETVYCNVKLVYGTHTISVLFDIGMDSCDPNLTRTIILATVIPGAILIIVILVVLYFNVPGLRKLIAPFHDRKHHVFTIKRPTRRTDGYVYRNEGV